MQFQQLKLQTPQLKPDYYTLNSRMKCTFIARFFALLTSLKEMNSAALKRDRVWHLDATAIIITHTLKSTGVFTRSKKKQECEGKLKNSWYVIFRRL